MAAPPPPPNNGPPPAPGIAAPNHPKAVPILIVGIIALACFILTWIGVTFGVGVCCPPIGIVCGIVALVMGVNAKKEIKKDPRRYGGDGLILGGMVCGGIGLGLCALQVIAGIIMAIFWTAIIVAYFGIIFAFIGCNSSILAIGILGIAVTISSLVIMKAPKHLRRK